MTKSTVEATALADYAFRFDTLPERVTFTRQIKITGWLLHRQGLPVFGIRGIVRGVLWRRSTFRARRKKSRPLIAAAYPDLPEAGQSGFLLEVELPLGRSELAIQAQDHQRIWRTIFVTDVWAFPLTLIGRIGLPRVEQFLAGYLGQLFLPNGKDDRTRFRTRSTTAAPGSFAGTTHGGFTCDGDPIGPDVRAVDLFVTSKSNLFIREIAELVCAGFRAAGCESQLLVDEIPTEKTEPGRIQIVVTPHEFYNLFLRDKLPWEQSQLLTRHLFLLGTEQPESEWFDSNLVVAPHARGMLDIHYSGVAEYSARGLRCFHLPLGYHQLLEEGGGPVESKRDIDICLLAAKTDRREEFIAANADFFAARNCHLRLVPIEFAKTKETRSYLSTAQRNRLLRQSKILLNVHYSNLRYFEWHRALIALANRCCLITETCEGFEPLVPGKHFVMAKAEDLTACCEYYLKHEHERHAIAEAGYRFVRERFTQKDNCRAFLQRITKDFQQRGAESDRTFESQPNGAGSLVEPLPHSLAKDLSRKPLKLLFSALREDLSNTFRLAPSKPARNARRPVDPAEMARRISTVANLRLGYIERLEAQKKCQQRGETIFQLIDSARFSDSAPAISVVVTLYNYAVYIQQCLRSLEDSLTAAIPGGIEVVIVNDASTDDSLKRAIAFQGTSRHPVRIVDKRLNTGLADARNIGLQLARAPYVLIMDADNLVFPRALEQLHARIVKDDSGAVYSILCRFESALPNRQGLLSYYDWDPHMLVEHPYIDAMALFDRRQLIEIGGYDTELFRFGWFGWEDYDLWLRIADAKLRISFVPNVLCLYRHHEKAMSNATNLFERELVTHLLERYRSLIERYPPKKRIFGLDRSRLEERGEGDLQRAGEPTATK